MLNQEDQIVFSTVQPCFFQVIYPHTPDDMKRLRITDEDLEKVLVTGITFLKNWKNFFENDSSKEGIQLLKKLIFA